MSFLEEKDADVISAKFAEAKMMAENHPPLESIPNKKISYNEATGKNDILMPNGSGGHIIVGEASEDRTKEIQGYAHILKDMPFNIKDYEAAGYTLEEVEAAGVMPKPQEKTGRTEPLRPGEELLVTRTGGDLAKPPSQETLPVVSQNVANEAIAEFTKALVRGGVVKPTKFLEDNFGIYNPLRLQIINPDTGEFDLDFRILSFDEVMQERDENNDKQFFFDIEELVNENEDASIVGGLAGGFGQFLGAFVGVAKFFKFGQTVMAQGFTKGAAADFLAFEGNEGRLTDVLVGLGVDEKFIPSFLVTDPNDPDYVGRFKTALEGGPLGVATEGLLLGIGKVFRAIKDRDVPAEEVAQITQDGKRSIKQIIVDRLNQPGDMPTVGSMGGNAGEEINKAIQLFDQAKIRREGTTGRYVGGPPGLDTPQKLASLRKKVADLTLEGEPGRFWYERSGKAILDAVGGDKVEAEKIAQAIAITSSGTPVSSNFDYALQAYLQNKAGQPINTGRFPAAMSKRLTDMFDGTPWEGRKTNSFYVNLMREIDPTLDQPVTVDIWMLRAFGYKTDNPTDQQYTFVENEVNKLADELDWEPQQVQAAIWVKAKADDEGISVSKAKFDYADALEKNKMQISWESIPGRTSGHMLEIFDAPYEVQQQYHVDISKAFLDDNGNDIVAQRLGIPSPGDFEAPGYFEGKVSPGTQTELAVPRQYKGPKYGALEPAALDLVNAYAAVRGILMKQDGVGFHRPFFNPAKKDANGIQVDIGRNFNEEETAQFAQILSKLSGHSEYNPIGSTGGVRIINFDYLEFDNKEFIKLVDQALDELDLGNTEATVKYFASQNGYAGNDWSVSKNGEGYISQLGGEGRSDIQRKIRDVITELSPRIDAVDSEYQIKYGFKGNSDINAEFRTGIEPPTEP